ncbi:hypothetical protein [Nocardioides pantholopis]|uniref:hypothetical protein n=1 Tax=Nocardioides pantholopis TaxID=2483798 RepID=UPI000F094B4E|nr:hypothetical protein [Nocardioides pantholopis]
MGNGHTREIVAALREKADAAEVPVFVVLTRTPQDVTSTRPDEELASLVHAGVGQDGVYVVHTTLGIGHVGVWGDLDPDHDDDQIQMSLATYQGSSEVRDRLDDEQEVSAATTAALALDVAGGTTIPPYVEPWLSDDQLDEYTSEIWVANNPEYDGGPDSADVSMPALVGVAVGLTVATLAYRALRSSPGTGAAGRTRASTGPIGVRPPDPAPATEPLDVDGVRRQAASAVDRLAARAARTGITGDQLETALGCRAAAEQLLDSTEDLDVVGALVLARTGLRALEKRDAEPYRCCYVNPLHGAARSEREVGGGEQVPVCTRCARSIDRHAPLDPLLDRRRRGRDQPYYAGTSVWARTGYGSLTSDLWREVLRTERR